MALVEAAMRHWMAKAILKKQFAEECNLHCVSKTVVCLIFYKLELVFIIFGKLYPNSLKCQKHLIFTYCTLHCTWLVENDAFSCHYQASKHAI